MTDSTRRVTMHDVARQAGVSYQTVSRVINNHPYVAEDTRTRVLQVIADLGYRPNKAARSLAAQQSRTLAVIMFGMDYYGPAQMMINIERAAKAAGYDLIFSNVAQSTVPEMRDALDSLEGWLVDGILAITPVLGVTSEEMQALSAHIPLVQIDIQADAETPSVIVDQQLGAALVTQHLIDLGHRHIAEISGPLHWHGAIARHRSWEQTIYQAGLRPGPTLEGDWTSRSSYELAGQILDRDPAITGLVVGNDQMALGAIRALRERGLRIPADISITGFDDIPEASYFEPPLTTVRQAFDALGIAGVECLIQLIEHPTQPLGQHVIRPQFIPRASTASPRDG
jgi:DNA-binding LacI/PurR family transcriptional regulator